MFFIVLLKIVYQILQSALKKLSGFVELKTFIFCEIFSLFHPIFLLVTSFIGTSLSL